MQCNCAGHKFTFRSSLGFSSFLHDYKVTVLTRTTSLTSYRSLLHKEQGVLSYQWNIFEESFVQSWMLSPLVQTSKSINKKHKTEQANVIYSLMKYCVQQKVAGLAGLRKPRPEILALCFRTTKTKTLVHIPFKLEKQFKTVSLNKN